jgi:hypothetical protein
MACLFLPAGFFLLNFSIWPFSVTAVTLKAADNNNFEEQNFTQ